MLKADLQQQAALLQLQRDNTIQEVSANMASSLRLCTTNNTGLLTAWHRMHKMTAVWQVYINTHVLS